MEVLPSEESSRDSLADTSEHADSPAEAPAAAATAAAAVAATRKQRGIRALTNAQADGFGHVSAARLFEYEWPPKSSERYFIQEQLGAFLDVKSFKRKYPDLTRRAVEVTEREYLKRLYVVTQTQADLGLTAVRSIEALDLMVQDYPAKYAEYQKAAADRNKLEIAEKQRELETIKCDSKKLAELRKRAAQSASEFSAEMNRERKRERKYFWDLQTMDVMAQWPSGLRRRIVCVTKEVRLQTIQSASGRWKKLPPEATKPSEYPVALIPGQFSDYMQPLSSAELRRLPIKSVTDAAAVWPRPPRLRSPPPILVNTDQVEAEHRRLYLSEGLARRGSVDSSLAGSEAGGAGGSERCAVCSKAATGAARLCCAQCGVVGHAACLDVSEQMLQVVSRYDWMCMECKPCSVCASIDDEDKMLFCDRCDRGYHTFCVGLGAAPRGRWVCAKYCGGAAASGNSGRATPVDAQCVECGDDITKENRVHHRSRYRHAGLCDPCVKLRTGPPR